MLIEPFIKKGHKIFKYFSSYKFNDNVLFREFLDTTKPDRLFFSDFDGSDPFTAKGASFNNLKGCKDIDVVILTRFDLHFSKIMANENINFKKFNFLFAEGNGEDDGAPSWWERNRFTCDNFYTFPYSMHGKVGKAIQETYCYPRGKPMVDTHGLYDKLIGHINKDDIHFISNIQEISDVNSYYTCCRSGLPTSGRGAHIHPEVRKKYYDNNS
jgi:hypothetical protein